MTSTEGTRETTYFVTIEGGREVRVTAETYAIDSLGALGFQSGDTNVALFTPGYWLYVHKKGSAETMPRRDIRVSR